MKSRFRMLLHVITIACLALCLTGRTASAQEQTQRTAVLDTTGFWRITHQLQPPVIKLGNELQPILTNQWLDRPTSALPQDWLNLDFDDSSWTRGPLRIAARTPYASRIAARARFTVDNPATVKDLRLSAAFHGGMVVYVNGVEISRKHLPGGPLDGNTLAEPYPREAYVNAAGKLLVEWTGRNRITGDDNLRRLALRERSFEDLQIPASALRPGVNVLALEVRRAPYDAAIEELKTAPGRKGSAYNLSFNTCEIIRAQLSVASPTGISQEAVRPEGLQLWNSDPLTTDFDLDFAGPTEKLYPMHIVGPRGGIISGKVGVGSHRPLEELKATLSPLTGPSGATIAADAVRLRYALPWGSEEGVWGPEFSYWDLKFSRYPRQPTPLGALATTVPDSIPVRQIGAAGGRDLRTPNQPEPVFGAVTSVWVTVSVPPDARPGVYKADLRIEAKGEAAQSIPVEINVIDWTLPEPSNRRTWVELVQVPDTTAIEYDLQLWSDEHWRMMARSFNYMSEVASRVVHLPLVCNTNKGTSQSMVRWIEQADGSWKHDFSILERYLDTAIQNMGKPQIVVLYAWEIYQLHPEKIRTASQNNQEQRALENIRTSGGLSGPIVTTVNAAGEVDSITLPHFDEPESLELWKPVFKELRAILQRRGLLDAATIGCMSDAWPNAGEVAALKELSGDLPWVSYSHMGVPQWRIYDLADVRYQATVTQTRYANSSSPLGSHHGWAGSSWPRGLGVSVEERLKHPGIFAENGRGGRGFDNWPASRLRHVGEFNITGDQRGVGRVGADFWHAVRDRAGVRRARAAARYPQSSWRNQDLESSLLAPGPDGPVATPGFEAFREGMQECEARIVIEEALLDDGKRARLGQDLAKRCVEALTERTDFMLKSLGQMRLTGPDHWYVTVGYTYWHRAAGPVGHQWYLGSQWQQRSATLFQLAAEVTHKLK